MTVRRAIRNECGIVDNQYVAAVLYKRNKTLTLFEIRIIF